jgi:hypothetical protein
VTIVGTSIKYIKKLASVYGGFYIDISPINFTQNKIIRMSVRSSVANTPILLKLESASGYIQHQITIPNSDTYTDLYFNYSQDTDRDYNNLTIIYDSGLEFVEKYVEINAIEQVATIPLNALTNPLIEVELPINEDYIKDNSSLVLVPFGGAQASVRLDNDNQQYAIFYNKDPVHETFAGFSINLTSPIDQSKTIRMRVMCQDGAPILLKLESDSGNIEHELNVPSGNTYTDLYFNYSQDRNSSYNKLTIISFNGVVIPYLKTVKILSIEQVNTIPDGAITNPLIEIQLPINTNYINSTSSLVLFPFDGAQASVMIYNNNIGVFYF